MHTHEHGGATLELRIVHAGPGDIDRIAPLFDSYRQFYGQEPDVEGARDFIAERLGNLQSVILMATGRHDEAIGFTQLYPAFSSVSMRRIWILNDLYVVDAARRKGVAWALIEAAQSMSVATGAKGLVLATAIGNHGAKTLYESFGFIRDDEFHHYFLAT